jgi:hypothetical protein
MSKIEPFLELAMQLRYVTGINCESPPNNASFAKLALATADVRIFVARTQVSMGSLEHTCQSARTLGI